MTTSRSDSREEHIRGIIFIRSRSPSLLRRKSQSWAELTICISIRADNQHPLDVLDFSGLAARIDELTAAMKWPNGPRIYCGVGIGFRTMLVHSASEGGSWNSRAGALSCRWRMEFPRLTTTTRHDRVSLSTVRRRDHMHSPVYGVPSPKLLRPRYMATLPLCPDDIPKLADASMRLGC
jgi:hypothetical protein